MNVTILGANGAIGRILTNRFLASGDCITAYVRQKSSIEVSRTNLVVVEGDLSNTVQIERAISTADTVISTLGPALDMSRKNKGTPIADGHQVIIDTMRKLGKTRLVTLGTPTVHADEDRRQLWIVAPPIMASILFPNGYREMKKIERMIKGSGLDWTVVRYVDPSAKHGDNGYSISLGDAPIRMSVSRENVAAFVHSVVKHGTYMRKMPIVFNK